MDKIKILYILPKAQQGGAETQLLNLLKGINKSKFEVYLGFLYDSNELKVAFSQIKGVKVVQFNKKGKFDVSVYFKIAKFAKNREINIIHSFIGSNNAYLPALIYGSLIPVGGIMSSVEKELTVMERIERFVVSRLFTKTKHLVLVSCSYSGMDVFLRRGFSRDAIRTITNGIDVDMYLKGNGKKIEKELGLNGKFVIGTVGRLSEEKNHEELMLMFNQLSRAYPKSVLLVVGGGPLTERLNNLRAKLGLQKRIILTGNRQDVPDLLAAMDIFVLPSLTEGWPNVLGEAMVAGLPVVSYPVGDVKYVIKNNINGIMVENNMESLKKAVIKLMKNKSRMKQMGIEARKTIADNFSVEKMVREYEDFYVQTIMNRKNSLKPKQ